MENVIDAIRAAVAPGASAEAKAAGVTACNAILAALQAMPGETLPAPAAAPRIEIGPAAAAFAAMVRSAPPEQLLDLAIAKLRSMVPADASTQPARRINIPLVQIPRASSAKTG